MAEVFGRRLLSDSPRPIAIALSGGGDSLTLTLLADAWARAIGRPLLILTVDHGLQAESRDWTERCAAMAARLDRPFQALSWTGAKPAAGIPAAARAARHRLLAGAARGAGAGVLLLGHTADDIAEAQAMRRAGSTTPDPREWAPSPAWPEGRGVFLLRPLLDVRRQALRGWLAARGETWIDDPANTDVRYARSRARATSPPRAARQADLAALEIAGEATYGAGMVILRRSTLRAASLDQAHRLLGLAAVCAGGGARLPAAARVARATAALRGEGDLTITLAGARLEADGSEIKIFREAGEIARGGRSTTAVQDGDRLVWDGRFELAADGAVDVRRLSGLARRLPRAQWDALRRIPAAARGGLPAMVDAAGAVTCPALTGEAIDLVPQRLRAAAGLVGRELG